MVITFLKVRSVPVPAMEQLEFSGQQPRNSDMMKPSIIPAVLMARVTSV